MIAKLLISSAQMMDKIDKPLVHRMCRNIYSLQQTLTNITMTREIALDHARHYFELFFLSPEVCKLNYVLLNPQKSLPISLSWTTKENLNYFYILFAKPEYACKIMVRE